MKRAILTGFEPFGNYKFNPVQDTAIEYDKKKIGDIEVVGLVVPSTYYGAFEVLSERMDNLTPDIVLGTGLASRVKKIRFETVGRNIMDGKYPDADGLDPKGAPIIPNGKSHYRMNSDSAAVARHLIENGVPAEVSEDAECFICESLIYLTARRIRLEGLPIRHAFFHTPWTEDYLGRVELEPGKIAIPKYHLRKAIELSLGFLGKD